MRPSGFTAGSAGPRPPKRVVSYAGMAADLRRFFDEIEVGEEYESPGRTVTETDIVIFAGLSGDYNVLHTDAEFMKGSIFGERIAHGLLGLAIQAGPLQPRHPALRDGGLHRAPVEVQGAPSRSATPSGSRRRWWPSATPTNPTAA